eukprot:CAMPEP_0172830706 /NCGR_PEP_ID=MMETSP1075-20121228/22450_1 /TAXON_ID=2916 /ORGANISM="Ceratium fusus, Strain PA161109" /LENGTH=304 /DNA_ID=CAMNT_0013673041 /DNA_START=36 /DNA_END=950 /DNA_ORIENTATION=-
MGMLIKNLSKAFDTTDVGNNDTLGGEKCRLVCASYLFCQYWQYSTQLGCLVEDPAAKEVAYPLVKDSWAMETDTSDADSVKMGQYIQHTCNVGLRVPFPTDAPGMKFSAVVTTTHPSVSVAPPTSIHYRDAAGSEKGTIGSQLPSQAGNEKSTIGSQSPSQSEVSGGPPLWLKALIGVGIALCLAGVASGAYMAIVGHKKGARGLGGGSKKAGPSRRSQRTEHLIQPPSLGNMNGHSEPVAWQQGETVPFMQSHGGQGCCHGQPQGQQPPGNYGNLFPQPQQGYMPTQPQMYQPLQQHGYQGHN